MTVKEYTKEFYMLSIIFGQSHDGDEAIARYFNGILDAIQDEMSMLIIWSVGEAYQLSLKAKEKLPRK